MGSMKGIEKERVLKGEGRTRGGESTVVHVRCVSLSDYRRVDIVV